MGIGTKTERPGWILGATTLSVCYYNRAGFSTLFGVLDLMRDKGQDEWMAFCERRLL
jgi:hypothetical protein